MEQTEQMVQMRECLRNVGLQGEDKMEESEGEDKVENPEGEDKPSPLRTPEVVEMERMEEVWRYRPRGHLVGRRKQLCLACHSIVIWPGVCGTGCWWMRRF